MPTKRQLEKKSAQLTKLTTTPMTEVCYLLCLVTLTFTNQTLQSDVAAILARKSQVSVAHSPAVSKIKMEKSRLTQARTLAIRRQDGAELEAIDAQLAELAAQEEPELARHEGITDMLAKV